jgi:hypothetical protein
MSQHPLSREEEWYFSQHSVKVRAPIFRVVRKKKSNPAGIRSQKMVIQGGSSCREGVIGQIRTALRSAGGNQVSVGGGPTWKRRFSPYGSLELDRDALKKPGESFVAVHSAHITANRSKPNPNYKTVAERRELRRKSPWAYQPWHYRADQKFIRVTRGARLTNAMIQDFLDTCDAVVGPLTVLLNPDRYQGNWWFTGIDEALETGKRTGLLHWYGVDNTVIAHPALASLYSGLVRQCAYIARTGAVDQIREDVEGMGLEECLNESDEVQALRIAKKMQQWISVPNLRNGHASHIPVGCGTFPKILALHKSIYRHGFEATFKASFIEGWGLGKTTGAKYNGIHTYMGQKGENNNGKRIKRLSQKKAA